MTIEDIAHVCHDANRAFCISIGDYTQNVWEHAEHWQRLSAIAGVQYFINFPYSSVMAQHEAWMEDKLESGWKYGPVKDPERREHPCMVPYKELPENQKAKDQLFRAVCRALVPLL